MTKPLKIPKHIPVLKTGKYQSQMPNLSFFEVQKPLNPTSIQYMRTAAKIAANCLAYTIKYVQTERNLLEIDEFVHNYLISQNVWPTPNGF